jgi:hypothetical protein
VESTVFDPFFQPGNEIALNVTGGMGEISVMFHYRSITSQDFNMQPLSRTDGVYQVLLDENWFDDLGLEFFFTVTDQASHEVITAPLSIHHEIDQAVIPVSGFGGKMKDYRIIAIPYMLEDMVIENMFEPALGAYDKSKWRLVRYQNTKNVDYLEGLSKTRMERGNGYWFNSSQEVLLQFGKAYVANNTQTNPFLMTLQTGWNQIGNPYPFDIDWQVVLDHNGLGIGQVITYDPATISLSEQSTLKAFEGGFLWADEPVTFSIPVTAKEVASSGGRKSGKTSRLHENENGWFVPVTISQGGITNTTNGFGMHPNATDDKDRFDLPVVPRFIRYAEWKSSHPNLRMELSRDVVSMHNSYAWTIEVDHNSTETVTIQWSGELIPDGSLILVDVKEHVVIDMKNVNEYSFHGAARSFKIFFNLKPQQLPHEEIRFGIPYPNPAQQQVTIPYGFSTVPTRARLIVRSSSGVKVTDVIKSSEREGIQTVLWDLKTQSDQPVPSGVYFFELFPENETHSFRGRIIVVR